MNRIHIYSGTDTQRLSFFGEYIGLAQKAGFLELAGRFGVKSVLSASPTEAVVQPPIAETRLAEFKQELGELACAAHMKASINIGEISYGPQAPMDAAQYPPLKTVD